MKQQAKVVEPDTETSDELAKALGIQIRGLRKTKGLTVKELAEQVGRSQGYLSQIETGMKKPSIGTLQRLADALGVGVGWFSDAAPVSDARERPYIVRSANRKRLSYTELGSTDYLGHADYLLSADLNGKTALVMTRFNPGASSGDDDYVHSGEETGCIIQGRIRLTLDGNVYELETGDSFSFPSNLPHRFVNIFDGESIMITAVTPPMLRY